MEQALLRGSLTIREFHWPAKVKIKDLSLFCRQLASLLEVGMPLRDGLQTLSGQALNKRLGQVTAVMVKDLDEGKSLSAAAEAFPGVFPPSFLAMVEAGELTGRLEEALDSLAGYYQKEYRLEEKVKSAMIYPVIVCITAFAVVTTMFTFIIPVFANVLRNLGGELPLPTRLLLLLSGFLTNNFGLLSCLTMGSYGLWIIFCKTERGQYWHDRLSLFTPGVGNIKKKVLTARFCRTLGALLTGGVPVLHALEVTKKITANRIISQVIAGAQANLSQGETMAMPLSQYKVFPVMMVRMVALGEETGTLEHMLLKVAQNYEGEAEEAMGRFISVLEPALTVILAVFVGFIVFSVLMPMFQIYSQVR